MTVERVCANNDNKKTFVTELLQTKQFLRDFM